MPEHYHYIIAGAGCAGSSLLMRMMREPFFADKKILVIDQSPKTENDRTWCFWEKQAGIFEPIVHHRWEQLHFFSNQFSGELPIGPYQYKMIRGIDLYNHVKETSSAHVNIEWRYEKINTIRSDDNKAIVVLETEILTADYVFNSILFDKLFKGNKGTTDHRTVKKEYLLLQHFKGWLIETKEPAFDPSKATFMDFRVSQEEGTTFIYLMPTSPTTALVEYTLFTENLLAQATYEKSLREYISSHLQLTEYKIVHEEFGIIPMTNHKFPLQNGRIVYMGIAGGQAKGSSGYAFQFIQKRTQSIVGSLISGDHSFHKRSLNDRKFHLYDSVLLNVLHYRKMQGADIFGMIFKKNPAERVLQFLDNESSLLDDLKIMRSVPSAVFLPAAFQELFT